MIGSRFEKAPISLDVIKDQLSFSFQVERLKKPVFKFSEPLWYLRASYLVDEIVQSFIRAAAMLRIPFSSDNSS